MVIDMTSGNDEIEVDSSQVEVGIGIAVNIPFTLYFPLSVLEHPLIVGSHFLAIQYQTASHSH